MISLLLMKQICELFLMMFMGFLLVKFRFLKGEDSKSFSKVVLYVIMPCVIINSFQIEYSESLRNGLLLSLCAAVFIHILLLVFGNLFSRLFKLDPVEKVSIMYSNAGNLIIPVVTAILGQEYVIYTTSFISVQLVLLWTHGKFTLCSEEKFDIKKIILNINMISILIGILLFIFKINLPDTINETMSKVSCMIGPLSMIITGMLIGNMELKKIYAYKRIYLITLLRMIVFPLIILFFLKISQLGSFMENGKVILLISFLACITPSASAVTQLSQIYGENAEYAGVINVVSTISCILTMPVMVSLYEFLY